MASNEQNSFSNLSVTSRTSQLILKPFPRFTNVTAHSPTLLLLHLHHNSFSNPSFASPTSQDLHLRHLESSPWSISETCSRVRTGRFLSDAFPIHCGLKQRDALSQFLIFLPKYVIRRIQENRISLGLKGKHQLLVYLEDMC